MDAIFYTLTRSFRNQQWYNKSTYDLVERLLFPLSFYRRYVKFRERYSDVSKFRMTIKWVYLSSIYASLVYIFWSGLYLTNIQPFPLPNKIRLIPFSPGKLQKLDIPCLPLQPFKIYIYSSTREQLLSVRQQTSIVCMYVWWDWSFSVIYLQTNKNN